MKEHLRKLFALLLVSSLSLLFLSCSQLLVSSSQPHLTRMTSIWDVQNSRSAQNVNSFCQTPQIIFEEGHQQLWSSWATDFGGYSDLTKMLIDRGYSISANTNSLQILLPNLSEKSILVLGLPKYLHYTDEEIDEMVKFVDRGGGLLIIGDHEHNAPYSFSEIQNEISSRFGIIFESNDVVDYNNSMNGSFGQWIMVKSDFFQMDNIGIFFADSLLINANATPVASASPSSEPPSAVVAACTTYGEGRVMCVCDSEFLWNGNDVVGIRYGNNTQFTLKIFDWLSNSIYTEPSVEIIPQFSLITAESFRLNLTIRGTTDLSAEIFGGVVEPTFLKNANGTAQFNLTVNNDGYVKFIGNHSECVVRFLKPNGDLCRVLFDETNYCRKVDESWSGLLHFAMELRDRGISIFATRQSCIPYEDYDAVVIANPLEEKASKMLQFLNSTKILLIGEADTWLGSPHTSYILEKAGYKPRRILINDLAVPLGLRFTNYTIYDPSSNNPFFPKIHHVFDFNFTAYRATVLSSSSDVEVLATGTNRSWGELVDPFAPFYEKNIYDSYQTPLMMCNQHVMAIGDLDPITNSHIFDKNNNALVDVIASWLIVSGEVLPKVVGSGHTLKIVAVASPNTKWVNATMEDGTIVHLQFEPSIERWVGVHTIPRGTSIGKHTLNITALDPAGNGYSISLEYRVGEDNLAILWSIVVVLSVVIMISFYFSRKNL